MRVIVHEELQVAADDEGVKQLLVNDGEFLDRVVLPRIEHLEGQADLLVRLRRLRRHGQIQVVFGRIGNAGDERHAAARAIAGIVGADVRIHRTDVGQIPGGRLGGGWCVVVVVATGAAVSDGTGDEAV